MERCQTETAPGGIRAAGGSSRGAQRLPGLLVLFLSVSVGSGAWGCGPSLAVGALKAAEQQVARAEFVGAFHLAPFEFHQAVEYQLKAQSELAEGDFGQALRLARLASSFASGASARSVRRGAQ